MRPIGIFGGTFDPIHYGHLRTALELKALLELERVHIVPVADPPHRTQPMSDGALRLRMVEAAIRNEPGFVADDRELKRSGVSYTDRHARELPCGTAGALAMSAARHGRVLGVAQWHRWRELTTLAHIVVAHHRAGRHRRRGRFGELLRDLRAPSAADLAEKAAGYIHVQPVTQLEISSTDLRDSLRAGRDPKFLVPDRVREIIIETECYAESL